MGNIKSLKPGAKGRKVAPRQARNRGVVPVVKRCPWPRAQAGRWAGRWVTPPRFVVHDDCQGLLLEPFAANNTQQFIDKLKWQAKAYKGTSLWLYEWSVMLGSTATYATELPDVTVAGQSGKVETKMPSGIPNDYRSHWNVRSWLKDFNALRVSSQDTLQRIVESCREAGIACVASMPANQCYRHSDLYREAKLEDSAEDKRFKPDEDWAACFYNGDFWFKHSCPPEDFLIVDKVKKTVDTEIGVEFCRL